MGQIIEITDLSAPELDVYARLTEAQLRSRRDADKAIFVAESPNVIARALDAGCAPVSFLMERRHIEGQASELLNRCPEIPVYTADREVLAGLTGSTLIYIGRSDVFSDRFSPKVFHLAPLLAVDTKNEA